MGSVFSTYLELGFDHILDIQGYDHILFIIALCAIYRLREWKRVAILVTAFTLGHSLTLALAALEVVAPPAAVIETLIPITILVTALYNTIFYEKAQQRSGMLVNYCFAGFFGLIHGLGFSNFFRASLLPGLEEDLVLQLFAFNVGVELRQLLIVFIILLISFLAFELLSVRQRSWTLFVSGAAAGISITLLIG